MKQLFWLGLISIAVLNSCFNLGPSDGVGKDEYYPPQTRIVRIDLVPDTVATQDTVLIHCVIEDSLDLRFKYKWSLGKDTIAVNGTVYGPYIRYIAPDLSIPKDSVYKAVRSIVVDNGHTDSLAADAFFDIPIIKK